MTVHLAFVIPWQDLSPLTLQRVQAVWATACAAVKQGHRVTVLASAQNHALAEYLDALNATQPAIHFRRFELPREDTSPSVSERRLAKSVRDALWTRFLADLDPDVVVYPTDEPCQLNGPLEKTSGKVVVALTMPAFLRDPSGHTLYATPLLEGVDLALEAQGARADDESVTMPHFSRESNLATASIAVQPLLSADGWRALLDSVIHLPRRTTSHPRDHGESAYRSMIRRLNALEMGKAQIADVANAVAFNEGPRSVPLLLLDVSVIVHGDARSGIQRVVRSLVIELLRSPPADFDVRPVYFWQDAYYCADRYARRLMGEAESSARDSLVDARQGDVYLALDLNTHLVDVAAAVHQAMRAKGVSMNFIVYDILLLKHPEWWISGTSEIFLRWLRSIATLADGLYCISAAVARDVRSWLEITPLPRMGLPDVRSFHLGGDVSSSVPSIGLPPDGAATLARLSARPSFLMVGTLEPRKGHAQTLDAFEMLWARQVECNLVIVGKVGWLVETLVSRLRQHGERGRRLFWLEGISDEFLEHVYAASKCLLVASEGEGFGLPLTEAAHAGLPILARDLDVFREVAGDHAAYFKAKNGSEMADAISGWLDLYRAGKAPQSDQMPRLTWQESARQLICALTNKESA